MNVVLLNGGLGNNLFQFAYGFSSFVESELIFDWSDRKSLFSKSKNSLIACKLPKNTKVLNHRNSSLLFKLCNLHLLHLLSVDTKSRIFIRIFFDWFLTKCVHQYLSLRYKGKVEIYLEGKKMKKYNGSKKIKVHLGYFQTEKFSKRVDTRIIEDLFEIFSKSALYSEYKSKALSMKPLVIHIRIGDYMENPELGQLSRDYFINALNHLVSKIEVKNIWIFSDSEELVGNYFPESVRSITTIIPTHQLPPGLILKIMSLGNAFVISNSSFSWWAAYLRENQAALVVAPSPWFAQQPWDKDLIPRSWEKMPATFNLALEN